MVVIAGRFGRRSWLFLGYPRVVLVLQTRQEWRGGRD
jgi:hypothetical protein